MIINEIFYSLQERASWLACRVCLFAWLGVLCDVGGAIRNMRGRRKQVEYSVDELRDKIVQWPTRYVVITGGEPMHVENLRDLCARWRRPPDACHH